MDETRHGAEPEYATIRAAARRLGIGERPIRRACFVNRLAPFVVTRGRSLAVTREPDQYDAAEIRGYLADLAERELREVVLTGAAESLWVEYSTEHDRRIDELEYPKAAVVKRVRDHVARLALVFATDAGREGIEPGDLLAAIEVGGFIEQSYDHLLAGRAPGRGPDRDAGIEATGRVILRSAAEACSPARDFSRGWPWRPVPGSREIQRALMAMDDVETVVVPGARKPGYRLVGAG